MLLYLTLRRLAGVNCDLDGLNFLVDVALDLDLIAFFAVLDIQEHVFGTRVPVSDGAERFATFTQT